MRTSRIVGGAFVAAIAAICLPIALSGRQGGPPINKRGPEPGTVFVYQFAGTWSGDEKSAVEEGLRKWENDLGGLVTFRERQNNETPNATYFWSSTLGNGVPGETNTAQDEWGRTTGYSTYLNVNLPDYDAVVMTTMHEGGHPLGLGDAHGTNNETIMNQACNDLGDSGGCVPNEPSMLDIWAAFGATYWGCDVAPDEGGCPTGYWLGDDDCCHDTEEPPPPLFRSELLISSESGKEEPVFGESISWRPTSRGPRALIGEKMLVNARSFGTFLVDLNSDDVFDDATEVVGSRMHQSGPRCSWSTTGALRELDKPENGGNSDGWFDSRDQRFDGIRIWFDAGDGHIAESELRSLREVGVERIAMSVTPVLSRQGPFGDRVTGKISIVKNGQIDGLFVVAIAGRY